MSAHRADRKNDIKSDKAFDNLIEPKIIGERRTSLDNEKSAKRSENLENSTDKKKYKSKKPIDWILIILAELFISIALCAGLFLVWKFVLVENVAAVTQSAGADKVISTFEANASIGSLEYDPQKPPVSSRPGHAEAIGVLYIPRLDPNYKRVIAEGTTVEDILNDSETGVGHYDTSQMPGELGNFALAGHRNTVFTNLKSIVPGDNIYVQTSEGYYTYTVKVEHEIVKPSDIQVIAAVPNQPEARPTKSVITLTTCWPEWSNTERLIVYADFVEWRPLAAGAPAEIAAAAAG